MSNSGLPRPKKLLALDQAERADRLRTTWDRRRQRHPTPEDRSLNAMRQALRTNLVARHRWMWPASRAPIQAAVESQRGKNQLDNTRLAGQNQLANTDLAGQNAPIRRECPPILTRKGVERCQNAGRD